MIRISGLLLIAALCVMSWAPLSAAQSRPWPALRYVGISAKSLPYLEARQAICLGLNKDVIVRAVAGTFSGPTASQVRPALSIQNPALPDYSSDVRTCPYNPEQARELMQKSAWTGAIDFLVGPNPSRTASAFYSAVVANLRETFPSGPEFRVRSIANFDSLFRSIRSDEVPYYLHRWLGLPGTPGYPSFALMIAERFKGDDPQIAQLIEKKESKALEQYLIDQAIIIPVIWEPQ